MTIKLKPSTEPKIVVTPSTAPKIDPAEVAKALGAEPMTRPPFVMANSPDASQLRFALHANQESSIHLSKEDWEQLVGLAQQMRVGDKHPTPEQVGRALLRKAIADLTQTKKQLEASIELEAQAAE